MTCALSLEKRLRCSLAKRHIPDWCGMAVDEQGSSSIDVKGKAQTLLSKNLDETVIEVLKDQLMAIQPQHLVCVRSVTMKVIDAILACHLHGLRGESV